MYSYWGFFHSYLCSTLKWNKIVFQKKVMAMNHARSIRHILTTKEVVGVACQRTFATGKAKKGSKGGAAADAPKASTLSKEVKSSTVVGANILKEGTDPKIQPDSEYPDWLWHLLDKCPALSELRRRNIDTLSYEDLKRFVKLDTRARIKENNSVKAKNWFNCQMEKLGGGGGLK